MRFTVGSVWQDVNDFYDAEAIRQESSAGMMDGGTPSSSQAGSGEQFKRG
jgi:hypothetical protein